MADEPTIKVHVQGLRNETAAFEGGWAKLEIGGMGKTSYTHEDSVLFTVSGDDEGTGKAFDVEVAIPVSAIPDLIEQLRERASNVLAYTMSAPITPDFVDYTPDKLAAHWQKEFGCTFDELKDAVKFSGHDPESVREAIKRNRSRN